MLEQALCKRERRGHLEEQEIAAFGLLLRHSLGSGSHRVEQLRELGIAERSGARLERQRALAQAGCAVGVAREVALPNLGERLEPGSDLLLQ